MWFRNGKKIRLLQKCEQLEEEVWNLHEKVRQSYEYVDYAMNDLLTNHVVLEKGELDGQSYFIMCSKESHNRLLKIHGVVEFRNSLQSIATKKEVHLFEDYANSFFYKKAFSSTTIFLTYFIYMQNNKIGRISIRYDGFDNHIYICEVEIFPAYRNKGLGTKVIQHLINYAKSLQVQTITGSARPLDDTISSDRLFVFYEKSGFSILNKKMGNFKMDLINLDDQNKDDDVSTHRS